MGEILAGSVEDDVLAVWNRDGDGLGDDVVALPTDVWTDMVTERSGERGTKDGWEGMVGEAEKVRDAGGCLRR